jgi:hypothetical protein
VRSLEEALVDQDARLDEVRRCAEDRLERLQHQDRERVRLTMVALRTELAGQPGVVALNRIETALSRLGAEPGTARPLLSASPTGSPPVSFATPRPALRPDPVEAPRGAAAVETPGTTSPPATQPEAMATTPDPVADTPPSPVVIRVLPVPAPVVDEVPRRGRRRNRRGALV